MSQYIFDNAQPQAGRRFTSLEALFDPWTIGHLERTRVQAGWTCLEIGGGGSSVAAWLAERVGASGNVLVTDIDQRHLDALASRGRPNLEVRRHAVGSDPLPERTFDLIHERLVLLHVPQRKDVLRRMVAALKPGGWLVVEDFDHQLLDCTFPTAAAAGEPLRTVFAVQARLLASRGADTAIGRKLFGLLRGNGLEDVEADGYLPVSTGGSALARLHLANLVQVRQAALATGLVSAAADDAALGLLEDPTLTIATPILMTAWGRRPSSPAMR